MVNLYNKLGLWRRIGLQRYNIKINGLVNTLFPSLKISTFPFNTVLHNATSAIGYSLPVSAGSKCKYLGRHIRPRVKKVNRNSSGPRCEFVRHANKGTPAVPCAQVRARAILPRARVAHRCRLSDPIKKFSRITRVTLNPAKEEFQ